MKYYTLNSYCFLVEGNNGGAVYDLCGHRIIRLSQKQYEILLSSESNNEININEMIDLFHQVDLDEIGEIHDKPINIDKIRYGIPKAISEYKPLPFVVNELFLHIGDKCDFNCYFCTKDNVNRRTGCKKYNKTASIEIDLYFKIIDHIGKMHCQTIHIMGADPLTDLDKVYKILEYSINNNNIKNIYLYTNGYRLNNFFEYNDHAKLNLNKLTFVIQVMSHENKINNNIIKYKADVLDVVNKNLLELKNYEIKFIVKILCCSMNYKYLNEMIQYYIQIQPNMIIMDWIYEKNDDSDYNYFVQKQIKNEVTNGINDKSFFNNIEYHPCLSGKITVFENGNIGLCPMLSDTIIGNISHDNLEDIINKDKVYPYWKLSINKRTKCSHCEYRFACRDCRALEEHTFNENVDKEICIKKYD